MVEQLKKWNLLVKLSHTQHKDKSPIVKRVMAADYATLLATAKKLDSQHYAQDEKWLRYHDGEDWIQVEDDMDLEFAYDFAQNKCKKQTSSITPATDDSSAQITFTIKPNVNSVKAKPAKKMKN